MIKSYSLCFFIFLYSCNTSPTKYKDAQLFSHEEIGSVVYLDGVKVEFDEMIMRPKCITIIDTILVITNFKMKYFIHRYDIKNTQKIGESISYGNGPEEMLSIQDVQISFDDTTMWLLDAQKQRVHQYKKYDICYSNNPKPLQTIQFDDFFDKIIALPNDKIVASTLSPNRTHLSFYDMQGELVQDNCDYPDAGIKQTPYERIESFLGSMVFDPFTKRIFFAYKQTDLIDIFDIDGSLLYRTHGPDCFFPKMKQRNNGNQIKVSSQIGKTRDGYYSPVVYNDEVWVLYSGKYIDVKNPNYLLDNIIVFNWEGQPVRQYKLSVPIYTFTIDIKNNILYGVSDDPQFHIIQFDL